MTLPFSGYVYKWNSYYVCLFFINNLSASNLYWGWVKYCRAFWCYLPLVPDSWFLNAIWNFYLFNWHCCNCVCQKHSLS